MSSKPYNTSVSIRNKESQHRELTTKFSNMDITNLDKSSIGRKEQKPDWWELKRKWEQEKWMKTYISNSEKFSFWKELENGNII